MKPGEMDEQSSSRSRPPRFLKPGESGESSRPSSRKTGSGNDKPSWRKPGKHLL